MAHIEQAPLRLPREFLGDWESAVADHLRLVGGDSRIRNPEREVPSKIARAQWAYYESGDRK